MVIYDFFFGKESSRTEAKKILEDNAPYEYLKTYFDCENMLLTDYRETECYEAIVVLKNYTGNFVVFLNCSCGYTGRNPDNTVALLELLHIPRETAESYVFHHNAVEIYFDKNGVFMPSETKLFGVFESRPQKLIEGQIDLSKITFSGVRERTMYLVFPRNMSYLTYTQLLIIMEPQVIALYYGSDSREYLDLSSLERHQSQYNFYKYPFVKIVGRAFDVVCILEKKHAKAFMNKTSSMLCLPLPFQRSVWGEMTFRQLKTTILSLTNKTDFYCQMPIRKD